MCTSRHALKFLLAATLGLSLLWMTVGAVFAAPVHPALPAHAKVQSADPGINSTVNKVPTKVTVFTLENINPDPSKSNLIVYGPSADATDTVISQGNAQIPLSNPKEMFISITPNKGYTNGVYVVYWKTVSADDGDPADGTFSFTVNTNGAGSTPATTQKTSTTPVGAPIWVPIVAALVALLVGLGAGLGLGRRKPAGTTSSLGAMRSAVTSDLQKK